MKLFKHQKEGVDFLLKNGGNGAFFWGIGTGKTLGGLEAYKRLRADNLNLRLLVLCPLSLIEAAWIADIRKYTDFTCHNLREKKFREADIYLANYEWLVSKKNQSILDNILSGDVMCICDESSMIKSHTAKRSKAVLKLKNRFRHRLVMSATPAPNTMMEYWTQIVFIADDILPDNFYKFRNIYFHLERGKQVVPGAIVSPRLLANMFQKGWKYGITDRKRESLMRRLGKYCHYVDRDKCLDLPDQVDELRFVYLSATHRKIYDNMKKEAIAEISGRDIVATVALAKIMKLRQITSGFAITPEGLAYNIGENPKLKELKAILEECGGNQVIIWANFHKEIATLKEALGDSAVCLYGETDDKPKVIEAFKSGEAQYLIAHAASAGFGLTLTNAHIQVFYSLDYSWERHTQAKGRTHRYSQNKKCVYFYILAKDTIDEDILEVLRRKGDAQDLLKKVLL